MTLDGLLAQFGHPPAVRGEPAMSDPTPRTESVMVAERIQRLIAMKRANTTIGQLEYLDQLYSDTVLFAQRPNDVNRLAGILDTLLTEIVRLDPTPATTDPTEQPVERSHSPERPDNAESDLTGPDRLRDARTA